MSESKTDGYAETHAALCGTIARLSQQTEDLADKMLLVYAQSLADVLATLVNALATLRGCEVVEATVDMTDVPPSLRSFTSSE